MSTTTEDETPSKVNGTKVRTGRKHPVEIKGPVRGSIDAIRSGAWRRRLASRATSRPVRTGLYRGMVLVADWVLMTFVTFGLIPMTGVWLHDQAGLQSMDLTGVGVIAVWLGPFIFLVAMITVAAFLAMRGMWRWSTTRIAAGDQAGHEDGQDEPSGGKTKDAKPRAGKGTTGRNRRKNKGRSKR